MQNNTKKKIAPVVIAVLVALYAGSLLVMVLAMAGFIGQEAAFALPFLLLYAFIGGAVLVGVLAAMALRLKEIDGGEEDEAKKY